MVLLVSHISGCRRTFCINKKDVICHEVLDFLENREGPVSNVLLQTSGRVLSPDSVIPCTSTVVATLRVPGGKGGFGSMLRAIGAQIEKTTNREACRDLSGRRLRDINEEKRLKDFIAKKAEREREMQEKKRKKFNMLKETPKHTFQDESYYQQRELREKNLYDSLDKAFGKEKNGGPSGVKRSCQSKTSEVSKAKKGRFLDDLDESSDEESDSEANTKEIPDKEESSSSGEDSTQANCEPSTSSRQTEDKSSNKVEDSSKSKRENSAQEHCEAKTSSHKADGDEELSIDTEDSENSSSSKGTQPEMKEESSSSD